MKSAITVLNKINAATVNALFRFSSAICTFYFFIALASTIESKNEV
jgi:hypothetical protein